MDRVRTLSRISTAPLICDGDTGYGGLFLHARTHTPTHTHTHTQSRVCPGLLNVAHTVEGYEAAGAAAIQLEDQEIARDRTRSHEIARDRSRSLEIARDC